MLGRRPRVSTGTRWASQPPSHRGQSTSRVGVPALLLTVEAWTPWEPLPDPGALLSPGSQHGHLDPLRSCNPCISVARPATGQRGLWSRSDLDLTRSSTLVTTCMTSRKSLNVLRCLTCKVGGLEGTCGGSPRNDGSPCPVGGSWDQRPRLARRSGRQWRPECSARSLRPQPQERVPLGQQSEACARGLGEGSRGCSHAKRI